MPPSQCFTRVGLPVLRVKERVSTSAVLCPSSPQSEAFPSPGFLIVLFSFEWDKSITLDLYASEFQPRCQIQYGILLLGQWCIEISVLTANGSGVAERPKDMTVAAPFGSATDSFLRPSYECYFTWSTSIAQLKMTQISYKMRDFFFFFFYFNWHMFLTLWYNFALIHHFLRKTFEVDLSDIVYSIASGSEISQIVFKGTHSKKFKS